MTTRDAYLLMVAVVCVLALAAGFAAAYIERRNRRKRLLAAIDEIRTERTLFVLEGKQDEQQYYP